ncbi:MAG: hypothetical protein JJU42_03360 [Rhodobacteraceae bacterium]|nr:hypothetical protein [Paracoccaceae bacterium]
MTDLTRNRRTIIVPEGMIDAVNHALGLSIQAAGWCDGDGHLYAAASYLSDTDITEADLPGLPVAVFDRKTPVVRHPGQVHVVNGRDGASTLDALGLAASEPDLS